MVKSSMIIGIKTSFSASQSLNNSLSTGAIEEKNILKFSKTKNILTIFDVTEDQEGGLGSFFAREGAGLYEKIVFNKCYISDNTINIIKNYEKSYPNIVIYFEKCNFSQEFINDLKKESLPILKSSVLCFNDYIIFPYGNKVKVNASIMGSIKFISNQRIILENINFDKNINALQDFFKNNFRVKEIIIDGIIGGTSQINTFLELIEKHHNKYLNLIRINADSVKSVNSTNSEHIIIVKNTLYFKGNSLQIPNELLNNIKAFSPGIISISFKARSGSENLLPKHTNFLQNLIKITHGVVFRNCFFKNELTHFVEKIVLDKSNTKLIGITGKIKLSESQILQVRNLLNKNGFLFLIDNQLFFNHKNIETNEDTTYVNGNVFVDANTLEIVSGISEQIFIKSIIFYNLAFNNKTTTYAKKLILNDQDLRFIVLDSCALDFEKTPFISFLESLHRKGVKVEEFIFIKPNTNGINLIIAALKKLNYTCSSPRVKFDINQYDKPSSPWNKSILNSINKCTDAETKKMLKSLIAMNPAAPGKVLAEKNGKIFPFNFSNNIEIQKTVRNNIINILNSWISGHELAKQTLANQIMNLIQNGTTGNDLSVLLYGPAGSGKTSFIYGIAAVFRYIDTGDVDGSYYNPLKGLSPVKSRFSMISMNQISEKGGLVGFEKTFKDSRCGSIIRSLEAKPGEEDVFMRIIGFDELDKMSTSKDNISDTLLAILDPKQRTQFQDLYFGPSVEFDLTKVMFIGTANDISKMPAHFKNRFTLIEVAPLSKEEFIEMAKTKWSDILKINALVADVDFSWENFQDFIWFIENIGAYNIRGLESKFEILANHIRTFKGNMEKCVVNKDLLLDLFPDVFETINYVKNKPGYLKACLKSSAGSFVECWVNANGIGRDASSPVNFIPTAEQNRDNGIYGIKDSIQKTVQSILVSVQNTGHLDSYKVKFNQSFCIGVDSDFSLDDTSFFCVQAVLSIISFGTHKSFDHLLVIGSTDVSGSLLSPGDGQNIIHRLNSSLNSKNLGIKKIFLPKSLSKRKNIEAMNIIKKWTEMYNIKKAEFEVHFVDNISEIVKSVLSEIKTN